MAGGLERQIVRTACELSKSGFQTIILSYDNEPSSCFYEIPHNVRWIKCGDGLIPHSSAPLFLRLKQIYKLRKILIRLSITHLVTFHHGIYPRSFLASLFLPIKKIVSERNSLKNYKYIQLSKFNLGFFSLYLSDKITVQLNSYILDYPKGLRRKIEVVPNLLITNPEYKSPNLNGNTIAMMGRLSSQKNFVPLLDQCLVDISNSKIVYCNESGKWSILSTDRYGFPNPTNTVYKDIDIVLLGDSFTRGACVDENQTLRHFLNNSLPTISLGNGGSFYSYYATFIEYVKFVKPKFTIINVYEGNDFIDLDEESKTYLKNYIIKKNFSQNLINKQKKIDHEISEYFNFKILSTNKKK